MNNELLFRLWEHKRENKNKAFTVSTLIYLYKYSITIAYQQSLFVCVSHLGGQTVGFKSVSQLRKRSSHGFFCFSNIHTDCSRRSAGSVSQMTNRTRRSLSGHVAFAPLPLVGLPANGTWQKCAENTQAVKMELAISLHEIHNGIMCNNVGFFFK